MSKSSADFPSKLISAGVVRREQQCKDIDRWSKHVKSEFKIWYVSLPILITLTWCFNDSLNVSSLLIFISSHKMTKIKYNITYNNKVISYRWQPTSRTTYIACFRPSLLTHTILVTSTTSTCLSNTNFILTSVRLSSHNSTSSSSKLSRINNLLQAKKCKNSYNSSANNFKLICLLSTGLKSSKATFCMSIDFCKF